MASIWDWSSTAIDNATADSDINWREGQAPSTINDSARVVMKRVKDFVVDLGGSITAGGTANTITVASSTGFTTLADGRIIAFRAASTNTGAATLNVSSAGAKAIRKMTEDGEVALTGNEIQEAGIYLAMYSTALASAAGGWLLINPTLGGFSPGMLMSCAGNTAPTGWLLCYGQAVSRTTYANLFAAISTTYGTGDGSTTFNLPDLRGRVVAGKDDMGGTSANRLTDQTGGLNGDTLGASGGSETHTLTESELAAHDHNAGTLAVTTPEASVPYSGWSVGGSAGAGTGAGTLVVSSGSNESGEFLESLRTANQERTLDTQSASATGATAEAGGGGAHNNVQPTIVLNWIIKT